MEETVHAAVKKGILTDLIQKMEQKEKGKYKGNRKKGKWGKIMGK